MNKYSILQLVKQVILNQRNDEITHLLVYFRDVDRDGIDEMVARYVINQDDYTTVLKYLNEDWVIFNHHNINLYPTYIHAVGGKKWGYINETGKYVIKPIYSFAETFQGNRAVIKFGELFGVINENGDYIIEPKYEHIESYQEKRAIVTSSEGKYVVDENGLTLTKITFPFISSYHESVAVVGSMVNEVLLYGYLDLNGDIVIPMKYQKAYDFNMDKALVKDEKYQLINKEGKVIQTYLYSYVGNYANNRLVFKLQDKCGYIDENGKIIIKPQYEYCQSFIDENAIINEKDELNDTYGLINLEGEEIFKPIYHHIIRLGNNRFALGKAKVKTKPYLGNLYALGNDKGEILTDFKFNSIEPYHHHLASVNQDGYTFFIDLDGEVVKNLPILLGKGTLIYMDHIIQANIDYVHFYINDESQIINYPNYIIPINDTLDVLISKYKPNENYLVYYPQIEKITIQNKVNEKLKLLSRVQDIPSQIKYEYYGNFKIINVLDDLLEIEIEGYKYQFGNAHGFPYRQYALINMLNGNFYKLSDLFIKQCDYKQFLTNWVKDHKDSEELSLLDENYMIEDDPLFYVDENNLYVVFPPYELAPYYRGFIELKIPFSLFMDCIDISSELWNSFHKGLSIT